MNAEKLKKNFRCFSTVCALHIFCVLCVIRVYRFFKTLVKHRFLHRILLLLKKSKYNKDYINLNAAKDSLKTNSMVILKIQYTLLSSSLCAVEYFYKFGIQRRLSKNFCNPCTFHIHSLKVS